MVQRKLVDSLSVVGSPAVAGKCPVGILPAADRTHLVDSPLEADHSHPVGILLAVMIGRPAGSHRLCTVPDGVREARAPRG